MRSIAGSRLPTGLRNMYFEMAFGGTIPDGAWAYDTVEEWASVCASINAGAAEAIAPLQRLDPKLFEAELEHMEKSQVCWRDIGLGALTQWADIKVSSQAQADALIPRFTALGRRYSAWLRAQAVETLRELFSDDKVILSSGKGAPYWFPGVNADAAVALARIAESAGTVTELDRLIVGAGGAMMPMCFTSYIRVAGSRKARARYLLVNSALVTSGEVIAPKNRRVQAAPYHWNYPIVGVAALMKAAMRGVSNMNSGTVDEAVAASRRHKYTIALDYARWDESVSWQTVYNWRTLVYRPFLDTAVSLGLISSSRRFMLLEIDELMQEADQLGPPRNTDEAAVLGGLIGTIRSGERLTSQKGTDIARELNLLKLERLGIRGELFNQGDDTILCTDDEDAIDKLNAHTSFLDTEQTIAPDAAYLMKRVPGNYAYLCRMLYGNLNKEPRFEPRSLFHAAGAMWVRRQLLRGHPAEDTYYSTLKRATGRLSYTAVLAESSDGYELLAAAAAASRVGGGELEEIIDMIERAAGATLRADLGSLAARYLEGAGRGRRFKWLPSGTQQMPLGKFKRLLSSVTVAEAAEWIGREAYKKREYRIY